MNMLTRIFALTLGIVAGSVQAEQIIRVDGEDYLLSDLTQNCQSIANDPTAQIACFAALSQLMAEQSEENRDNGEAVLAAREALLAVAQYQDDETGLVLAGEGCELQVLYYSNYFHISRRNISSIDLFAARFDLSKFQLDQTVQVQGSQVPMLRGSMAFGTNAVAVGGIALESGPGSFSPRAPGVPLVDFANEVISIIPGNETQSFDFVLVHPNKSAESAEILGAFQNLVAACQG